MSQLSIFDVELVVADFDGAARLLSDSMGFNRVFEHAPGGARSLAMRRGAARVRLTGVDGGSEEARFIARHGSGVRNIGLCVPSVAESVARVVGAGGTIVARPVPSRATIALFDGLHRRRVSMLDPDGGSGCLPSRREPAEDDRASGFQSNGRGVLETDSHVVRRSHRRIARRLARTEGTERRAECDRMKMTTTVVTWR